MNVGGTLGMEEQQPAPRLHAPPQQQQHALAVAQQVALEPSVVFGSVNAPTQQYQRIVASLLRVPTQRQAVWNVVEKVSLAFDYSRSSCACIECEYFLTVKTVIFCMPDL